MTLTRISKILAVFVAVGSLAFVGFAIATTFGEPDPLVILSDPVFAGYSIAQQPGTGVWEAKRGLDGSSVGSSKNVYDVMTKVLDDVAKTNNEAITARKNTQTALESKISALSTSAKIDEQALVAFETVNREYLAKIRVEEAAATSAVITATADAQKLENAIEKRRQDVFRLKQQSEELNADLYRLQEIDRDLTNLRSQLEADVQRATDRNDQLKERLGY